MKMTRIHMLALAVTMGLSAPAFADHQPGHPASDKASMKSSSTMAMNKRGKTWNDQPIALRTVGFPIVFLGRAGTTLWHSPTIVRESFRGERKIMSKRGFFARSEEQPGQKVASASPQAAPNVRG